MEKKTMIWFIKVIAFVAWCGALFFRPTTNNCFTILFATTLAASFATGRIKTNFVKLGGLGLLMVACSFVSLPLLDVDHKYEARDTLMEAFGKHRFDLTDEMIQHFKDDGFLFMKQAVPAEVIEAVGKEWEANNGRNWVAELVNKYKNIRIMNWLDYEVFRIYIGNSQLGEIASKLLGVDTVILLGDLIFKSAKGQVGLVYHRGVKSYSITESDQHGVSIWCPVHPVPSSEHGGGLWMVPITKINRTECYPPFPVNTGFEDYTDCIPLFDAIREDMDYETGDCVAFNKRTIHKTRIIQSDFFTRTSVVVRFLPEGTISRGFSDSSPIALSFRQWHCSDPPIAPGKPLTGCFPRIYPDPEFPDKVPIAFYPMKVSSMIGFVVWSGWLAAFYNYDTRVLYTLGFLVVGTYITVQHELFSMVVSGNTKNDKKKVA